MFLSMITGRTIRSISQLAVSCRNGCEPIVRSEGEPRFGVGGEQKFRSGVEPSFRRGVELSFRSGGDSAAVIGVESFLHAAGFWRVGTLSRMPHRLWIYSSFWGCFSVLRCALSSVGDLHQQCVCSICGQCSSCWSCVTFVYCCFLAHAIALGIAALSVDLQLCLGLSQCCEICNKLGYCSGVVGSVADLAIAGVS